MRGETVQIVDMSQLSPEQLAQARRTTTAEIDKIGGGRVWTGEQAHAHGLVDELGGLNAALAKLREMAKLPPFVGLCDVPAGSAQPPLPDPSPTAALSYALESTKLFGPGRALLLFPWVEH